MISLSLCLTVFLAVFVAEMGDKTQLLLIALTSKYKVRDILIGTTASILVLNALAVLAGGLLNEFLSTHIWIVKLIACLAFFFFSVTSLMKESEEEESSGSKIKFAPLAVFCIFFIAEFGDKTQLTAITFGATTGLNVNTIVIWLASSVALLVADIIGLCVGYFLHGKTPDKFFNILAFVVFAVFGFVNLYAVFVSLEAKRLMVPIFIAVSVVFMAICGIILKGRSQCFVSQQTEPKNLGQDAT
ncbi:TMEM165/GDT1 family protein [Treponema sp.]|uniref:TMEM165/GDT1 family protein n=1 Tax=Treponema sp. TaxID=166 RepID=UPI0025D0E4E4|nr:TMEM165/GDT1 family protein [Treponema sp.]